MGDIAVRIVFGLLVVATLAAFLVTQRLKSSAPIVARVFYPPWVSPNADGRKDVVRMRFALPRPDQATVSVVDGDGDEVRRLADDRPLAARTHYFRWDGRDGDGRVVPDGPYRLRVTLRSQGRSLTAPRTVTVDTAAPRPRITAVTPATIVPGDGGRRGRARIRYEGPSDPAPRFTLFRTDLGGAPRRVASFDGPRFRRTAQWEGTVGLGARTAPDGIYAIAVTVRDRAGNAGTRPAELPPRRGTTAPRSGVSVRYLSLRGPLEPVGPRTIARFELGPRPRRFRWRLNRLGSVRPLVRGRGDGEGLAVRVPARARAGLHVLRVQAGGRHAAWPLAVTRGARRRPLVVVPALAWEASNRVDDDRDGFADTLATSTHVRIDRPLAHGRLPAELRRESGPLLRFLDSERLSYDLTTDIALARHPRAMNGRPALVFAGSEPWLTERLDSRLRAWVERGGQVASFGAGSFRRRVTLEATQLVDPSPPEPTNVFGERTSELRIPPAPMVVTRDRTLGMFAGGDGYIGLFSSFEQSDARVEGARLLAAAGREPRRPAFVAYRLGRGLVIRAGSAQWNRALAAQADVGAVTRRLWSLLER